MYPEDNQLNDFQIYNQFKQYYIHQRVLITPEFPNYEQFSLESKHILWYNSFSRLLFLQFKGTILKSSLVRFFWYPQSVRKVAGKKR